MSGLVRGGAALAAGLALTGESVEDFWWRYLAMGGTRTRSELVAYLSGAHVWSDDEHDIAALALNERCWELHLGSPTAYSDQIFRPSG